ncbi:hypothetical protein NCAS_0B07680 [Naumovozyma castellii]|uniref:Vacuolar protein sorting-associated protein 51 homolog n=1 Tax=Naumovozyma castellii TaxID=27288 RepID=G0VAC2_NAUCA|nr:hypothetical protein NCAS_0B07680 [Naumovozyma castellii CBS 4309]CCC68852.1 hypothetical protein NCAS_0B07680 [Naumovozyma castellii CBS 4309]
MAEQISHKKSLRVNRLNKDRRLLLKEYYKLEEGTEPEPEPEINGETKEGQEQEQKSQQRIPSTVDTPEPTVVATPMEDKPVSSLTFKELIQIHNKLLSKETETNNTIKNTIYENYYDLIKVNDLLKEVRHAKSDEVAQLKQCVDLLRDEF